MGSNSAALVEVSTLSQPQTAMEIRAQVNRIQEVMQAVMKLDVHYGKVPGCGDKPTLLKPGAEKLASTFHIAIEPIVEDLSGPDEYRVRVHARCTSMASGTYLGSGIGECSSSEDKYKWRAAVCDQEFQETATDRRRAKWKKGERSPYIVNQVRTEKADIANTVLKMAKKRALVDAILTVTAASDIFAQDIEDIPEEMREDVAENGQPAKAATPTTAMPQRKGPANATTPQTAAPAQTTQPEAKSTAAPAGTPPQKIEGLACPKCGEVLNADGCRFCGWEPSEGRPQQRQDPPASPRAPEETITPDQSKRFFAICMKNGITKPEMKQYLQQTFGIDDDRKMPKSKYEQAIAWAQGSK